MQYEIVHLPKDKWKGTIIPIEYWTNQHYKVTVKDSPTGYSIDLRRETLDVAVHHTPETYDYPDKLYQDHYENAYAWGILENDTLIAAIETNQETWSNRLRITELWVANEHKRNGIGRALVDIAKEQARRQRLRAVILETQSCNVDAIDFYRSQGFELIGFDTCCYSNDDIDRNEVRLEFGWQLIKKPMIKASDIIIREETEADWYSTELMTKRAFWNKHREGCDEHYLVNKIRQDKAYVKELSKVAVKNGEIIGLIMYTKALVKDGEIGHEVLLFGPLCVDPSWQGCGVGELLFKETANLATKLGYKGIVIFGEPDYYPRLGFKTCDNFGITTSEGKNFDAFMAYELSKDSLKDVEGKFYEAKVFSDLPKEEVDEYNKRFPRIKKMKFPDQWE